ncbi:hypothetical protein BG000_001940 [Podila horticola]|nr:hypothetical protein BG000_001940 [Podila horticola]
MFGVEEISLGYIPDSSQKLLQLIQYFPSLQRISFLGTWIRNHNARRDIFALSSSLRFFCPELRSIHTTAAFNFALDEYNTLDDSELASLIQSTKSLEHFKAEVASLGRLMSDSLITQYESLVAVDLCFRRRKYQHPHDGGGGNMGTEGGTGALIEAPTATPGRVRSSDILNTARILSSCIHLRASRSEIDEDLWVFGTEFPKKLFPQIGQLSLLKELCLNKVQYSRTAYT